MRKIVFVMVAAGALVALATQIHDWHAEVEGEEDARGPWLKPMKGGFWAHRVAYPTMHFSPSWYADARPADRAMASAVPAGE